jgi:hypothetical protein
MEMPKVSKDDSSGASTTRHEQALHRRRAKSTGMDTNSDT